MMSRGWHFVAIACAIISSSGCDNSTLLLLDIQGVSSEIQTLLLHAELNGSPLGERREVPTSANEVGILLDAGVTGSFIATVEGLDRALCVITRGTTDTVLTGARRGRLTLSMAKVAMPACPSPK